MKIARLLITTKCLRNCHYCCNKYSNIMKNTTYIKDIYELGDCDEICITGGEPLLVPNKTLSVVERIRHLGLTGKIYLYTAYYHNKSEFLPILTNIDGVHYTLHENSTGEDIDNFYKYQDLIDGLQLPPREMSFRLYIHKNIDFQVAINPWLYTRVEVKPWMSEDELLKRQPNGLPKNEKLFILK